ncbi:hypothetical protein D3C75_986270 [compost metagenome]
MIIPQRRLTPGADHRAVRLLAAGTLLPPEPVAESAGPERIGGHGFSCEIPGRMGLPIARKRSGKGRAGLKQPEVFAGLEVAPQITVKQIGVFVGLRGISVIGSEVKFPEQLLIIQVKSDAAVVGNWSF